MTSCDGVDVAHSNQCQHPKKAVEMRTVIASFMLRYERNSSVRV